MSNTINIDRIPYIRHNLQTFSIQHSENHIFLRTWQRYSQEILSYALAMSNFNTTLPHGDGFVILWTISCVNMILFVIDLPLMNPVWLGDISFCIKGVNYWFISLGMILHEKLLRLISLSSPKDCGQSTLGNRIRHVWVIALGIWLHAKKSQESLELDPPWWSPNMHGRTS